MKLCVAGQVAPLLIVSSTKEDRQRSKQGLSAHWVWKRQRCPCPHLQILMGGGAGKRKKRSLWVTAGKVFKVYLWWLFLLTPIQSTYRSFNQLNKHWRNSTQFRHKAKFSELAPQPVTGAWPRRQPWSLGRGAPCRGGWSTRLRTPRPAGIPSPPYASAHRTWGRAICSVCSRSRLPSFPRQLHRNGSQCLQRARSWTAVPTLR